MPRTCNTPSWITYRTVRLIFFIMYRCQLTRMQMGNDRPVGHVQDKGIANESLVEKQQQATIATLKASIEKLHLEKAKSDAALQELQVLRREAEERERAFKVAKER